MPFLRKVIYLLAVLGPHSVAAMIFITLLQLFCKRVSSFYGGDIKIGESYMSKYFTTKSLVISALLVAISVILRLLGFPQDGTFRFELGFLPIAISGYLYGGAVGGISYVIADIVGTLFTGMSPFFPITICKFLMGVIFGIFFHKGNKSLKNIIFCALIIGIFIDLVFMPFALVPISGGKTFFGILAARLAATAFNTPVRIVSLYLTFKYLKIDDLKER